VRSLSLTHSNLSLSHSTFKRELSSLILFVLFFITLFEKKLCFSFTHSLFIFLFFLVNAIGLRKKSSRKTSDEGFRLWEKEELFCLLSFVAAVALIAWALFNNDENTQLGDSRARARVREWGMLWIRWRGSPKSRRLKSRRSFSWVVRYRLLVAWAWFSATSSSRWGLFFLFFSRFFILLHLETSRDLKPSSVSTTTTTTTILTLRFDFFHKEYTNVSSASGSVAERLQSGIH